MFFWGFFVVVFCFTQLNRSLIAKYGVRMHIKADFSESNTLVF